MTITDFFEKKRGRKRKFINKQNKRKCLYGLSRTNHNYVEIDYPIIARVHKNEESKWCCNDEQSDILENYNKKINYKFSYKCRKGKITSYKNSFSI